MSNMSDFFPWEDIHEGNVFPAGTFMFKIEEINHENYSNSGKLMPKARFTCVEPASFKGMAHFDQYVVGTDENPTEVNPGTMGARSLKSVFKCSQTPRSDKLPELCANAVGNSLLLQFGQPTEDDYGLKSKVVGYYKIGEREVGELKTGKSATPATPAKSSAPMPTTAPPQGTGAAKPATVMCTVCNKPQPVAEFSNHIENCKG